MQSAECLTNGIGLLHFCLHTVTLEVPLWVKRKKGMSTVKTIVPVLQKGHAYSNHSTGTVTEEHAAT